jgi:predicted hotdog family 3-hydroxylacyl-ACP dehydratase
VRCELLGDNGLGMFDCRIHADGEREMATARVSVFEPEDGGAYIAAAPATSS